MCILTVNNLRDINEDKISGKKTLAVRWGICFTQWEYTLALLASLLIGFLHVMVIDGICNSLILAGAFLLFLFPSLRVWSSPGSAALNTALAQTGAMQFIVSLLYTGILIF